ncbi:hypothetical protein [Chitinophaga ginsengisoli]|uniref:Uncharacterized protein n=1 Tax=Chitinophaga ginsengisoli TaxID=363837 RepID=A0A2P8GHW2_9BACT|nr:hypothetical protein [Chitinophaga ginsengisoli]PSL33566.1 hypothetical protein CLV42_103549 [Chitinophaga ginsengisoli]
MKKARIILAFITLAAVLVGTTSFRAKRRQLSNLFYRTTGVFSQNGASRVLTYAKEAPYRTFQTDTWELPVNGGRPLYTGTTQSTTTVGGDFYFITVVTGSPWPTWLGIYDDNGQ